MRCGVSSVSAAARAKLLRFESERIGSYSGLPKVSDFGVDRSRAAYHPFPTSEWKKRQPVFMPMEIQGQTIPWERLTIAQAVVSEPCSVPFWDWDLANLDTPDDSCNTTVLFRWGSLAWANSMLAPTHQSSQRLPVSMGRLWLKLRLRTIRQGICLLGDSTCQTSCRDQLSFTGTDLPRLGFLTYPFTCHCFR
jgi:hypothetical protein